MFYSHDTNRLVATLGSRSITRRLNRKTILDVDVPKACNVIMDPQAPMALRLQGNLLYGVSRVYSQQCRYTLTDVQSMHDRMKTMLRILPGGALDPMAGKTRPDQLILPYDQSFTPENDLPGLDIDLAKLTLFAEPTSTEFAWPVTPDLSQSVLSQNPSLQLSFGSGAEDFVMAAVGGSEPSSVRFNLKRLAKSALCEEEEEGGVLLQPDFEFDEDGNIIELSGQRRSFLQRFETPLAGGEGDELALEYQEMPIDDMPPRSRENTLTPHSRPANKDASDASPGTAGDERSATVPQRRRKQKPVVVFDQQTALRNSELVQMNSEYLQNMAAASRQKKQNRRQRQAKKNAAFWVFGRGIGAVGVGVGASRVAHPLAGFSGQELIDLVSPEGKSRQNIRKRGRDAEGESDTVSGSEGRRVRAREEVEEQVGRGDALQNNDVWNEVEFGRHGSSALRDDSSQMPWNITASVQSSRHGSSAANRYRGVGSSSWGMPDSAGFGRPRSRLTSASPLAGRGFPFDIEGLDSLAIPGPEGDEIDVLGDFDLDQYLQTGLYADDHGGEGVTAPKGGAAKWKGPAALERKLENATLDQDSQNFLRFLVEKLPAAGDGIAEDNNDPFTGIARIHALAWSQETSFWDLLPPEETSRAVATHGLMHILALATKGFLMVRQEAYEDLSNEDGVRYEYGQIFVRLAEV
ncbi:Rec8 like protein-domain-containing protein [Aspergillus floccosus]